MAAFGLFRKNHARNKFLRVVLLHRTHDYDNLLRKFSVVGSELNEQSRTKAPLSRNSCFGGSPANKFIILVNALIRWRGSLDSKFRHIKK